MADTQRTGQAEPREPAERTPKQAVVIIHGMGEQRPMGTLRSFVASVWEHVDWASQARRDRGEDVDAVPPGEHRNQWWVKPDRLTGMHELRRITTGGIGAAHCGRGADGKRCSDAACPDCRLRERRVDFFEFYWADLMQGTTRAHVMSWVRGLLLRVPRSVPRQVLPVWIFLWAAIALTATVFAAGVLEAAGLDGGCVPPNEAPLREWRCSPFWAAFLLKSGFGLLAALVVLAALGYVLHLAGKGVYHLASDGRVRATFLLAALLLLLWGLYVFSLPAEDGGSFVAFLRSGAFNTFTAAAFAAAIYGLNRVLTSLFGDVARYVEASPANVGKRRAIRDRGLDLLEELHDSGRYDRIVVVGHSLGSIIAYDLINLLWARRGPAPSRPPSDETLAAMDEQDAVLAGVLARGGAPRDFGDLVRASQRRISRLLAADRLPPAQDGKTGAPSWLISDLITIGSPLTHAAFLLSRDRKGLTGTMQERSLPVCPPMLERDPQERLREYSFLYWAQDHARHFPHHASTFAAVRWTNIHDRPNRWLFLLGDVVSGPVGDLFGGAVRGVDTAHPLGNGLFGETTVSLAGDRRPLRDVKVTVQPSFWPWLPRLFTHTSYWTWRHRFRREVPHHIQALRDALRLGED